MNRNFYTNLKANNKMFYIGMFIILLSLVDVFINSFLKFNITFFLPNFFSISLPLIFGFIGLETNFFSYFKYLIFHLKTQ